MKSKNGTSAPVPGIARRLPENISVLGLVSMFMDISSELVHSLLPIFMASVLWSSMLTIGVVEGIAEAIASISKMFSGAIGDYFGKRKPLMLLGYGLSAATKPVFPMASSIISVAAARFVDRVGKGPARVNNWNGAGVAPNVQDQFSTRMDHSFSDSHKLFGRFSWSNINRGGFDFFGNGAGWVNPGGSGMPIDVNARNLSLDDTYTFTPTLLLNVRYGFVRQWVARDPPSNGLDLATLGFPAEFNAQVGARAVSSFGWTRNEGPKISCAHRWSILL